MSEGFIGEIRLIGFNFAPRSWAFCEGQLMPVAQNTALFSLLGTIYGGDGRTTFALPDLRGRTAIHHGQGPGLSNHAQGQRAGAEQFTLNANQMPSHTHTATLYGEPSQTLQQDMQGRLLGAADVYTDAGSSANRAMNGESVVVGDSGGGQSVTHRGPYLAVAYAICLEGLYPSRS